jgi:hypothetical protein
VGQGRHEREGVIRAALLLARWSSATGRVREARSVGSIGRATIDDRTATLVDVNQSFIVGASGPCGVVVDALAVGQAHCHGRARVASGGRNAVATRAVSSPGALLTIARP